MIHVQMYQTYNIGILWGGGGGGGVGRGEMMKFSDNHEIFLPLQIYIFHEE